MKRLHSYLRYFVYSLLTTGVLSMTSCSTYLPDDLDALGDDIQYTTTEFSPYLGRTTTFENIVTVSNNSTLPLTYEILDIKDQDGISIKDLADVKYPVKVWKKAYTGEETSIEEIESKRITEYRPAIDIQKKSGDIVFWNTLSKLNLQTAPYDGYTMDIAIGNTGGRKIQKGIKLIPYKERAYEPSQYDVSSGLASSAFLRPSILFNVYGENTGNPVNDVRVYINKDYKNTKEGSTLTFSVVDSLNNIIPIDKFKDTKWNEFVHGFNHKFVDGKIVYDVIYPMPLINYPTKFTTSTGNRARSILRYNRLGSGGFLQEAMLGFDFAIYEAGHWEIQFRFVGESPKFVNE